MIFSSYSIAAMLWPEKLGLPRPKDMTRRPVKENETAAVIQMDGWRVRLLPNFDLRRMGNIIATIYSSSNRLKWQVGRSYAICLGRGKPQVGRFTLATIGWELDVFDISDEDLIREGFADRPGFNGRTGFKLVWRGFYGHRHYGPPLGIWVLGMSNIDIDEAKLPPEVWRVLEEIV